MHSTCLFCNGKGRFRPAAEGATESLCEHCGGTGVGGWDREFLRRLPYAGLLHFCILTTVSMVVSTARSQDDATAGLFMAFSFVGLIAFCAVLGRVVRDRLPLLALISAGMAAGWMFANQESLLWWLFVDLFSFAIGMGLWVAVRYVLLRAGRERKPSTVLTLAFLFLAAFGLASVSSGPGLGLLVGVLGAALAASSALGYWVPGRGRSNP